MLNVSRTTVSESWLAAPLPLKSHKALDTRAVITSRFSVSTTINSDLFPELLSWSAMMDTQPASPCSQKFPSDVSKREPDVETVDTVLGATLCLSLIFDPTSLDFGFDHSCLEGLDDLLVYSPTEAFEESCWTEATHSHSDRMSTAVPFPFPPSSKKSMRRRRTRSPLVTSSSSDDSDTDSDECMTFKEDAHLDILNDAVSSGMNPVGEFPSYNTEKTLYFSDDEEASFMYFESSFAVRDTKDSVGGFPIPPVHRKTKSSRLAAFCASLPASLAFVRSPHSS